MNLCRIRGEMRVLGTNECLVLLLEKYAADTTTRREILGKSSKDRWLLALDRFCKRVWLRKYSNRAKEQKNGSRNPRGVFL